MDHGDRQHAQEGEEEDGGECEYMGTLCIPGLHYQSCKAHVKALVRENLNDDDFMTDLDRELLGDDIGDDPYNPVRAQGGFHYFASNQGQD